jgi:hypothetical protein
MTYQVVPKSLDIDVSTPASKARVINLAFSLRSSQTRSPPQFVQVEFTLMRDLPGGSTLYHDDHPCLPTGCKPVAIPSPSEQSTIMNILRFSPLHLTRPKARFPAACQKS